MARCEDFPCCGHEDGDCPSRDENGNERWTCVACGKLLPLRATSSICSKCQQAMFLNEDRFEYED